MIQTVSQATEDDSPANHPTFIDTVQETHHFVASLKHKMFVVKLGGMIPKITACLDALADVPRVHIVDGSTSHALLYELETHPHIGTTITR